eukprot:236478-Rhodomonas_salina.1
MSDSTGFARPVGDRVDRRQEEGPLARDAAHHCSQQTRCATPTIRIHPSPSSSSLPPLLPLSPLHGASLRRVHAKLRLSFPFPLSRASLTADTGVPDQTERLVWSTHRLPPYFPSRSLCPSIPAVSACAGVKFCTTCGTPASASGGGGFGGPPACTSCRSPLEPNAKFCTECGTPVSGSTAPTEALREVP